MKYENIQTFIEAYECGSLVKASNALFITQGTASARLKQLEQELGIQLFHRSKGQRQLSLTQAGEKFLPIARQWIVLWKDSLDLKNHMFFSKLKVGGADILNMDFFLPFYQDFSLKHEEIELNVSSMDSTEVYSKINNQLIDIGIVYTHLNYPHVNAIPLIRENLMVVVHQMHPFVKNQDFKILDPQNEIFLSTDHELETWHQSIFPSYQKKHLTVSTLSMLKECLDKNYWAIMPTHCAIAYIKKHPDFKAFEINNSPSKTVYLLTYKEMRPSIKKNCQTFIEELQSFVHLRIPQ